MTELIVDTSFSTCLILIFSIVYFITKLISYSAKIHQQNMQIIRLYLDKKFMGKILGVISDTKPYVVDSIYNEIKSNISNYFQLDDIILYDTNTHNNISSSKLQYKYLITTYLTQNMDRIINTSTKDNLSTHSLYQDSCRINLYITCSKDVGHDILSNTKLLICIQYHNTNILEHYEIETLKYVTKLLSSLRVTSSN